MPKYLITPDPSSPGADDEYRMFAKSYSEALDLADDASTGRGVPYIVYEKIVTVEPSVRPPLHEDNGVVPGVDFPFTLTKGGY